MRLARPRADVGAGERDRPRGRPRPRTGGRARLRRLPHRQGQGRRAGPDRGRRPGPGRGGPRRARAGRRGAGRRQRAAGTSTPRCAWCGCSTARPAGWSTSSSPAAPSRSWPRCAAGSTCRSPPTSRSAGPRTRCGWPGSRPPTSPCSRCSRSAAWRPACGSRSRSGCPWSCRRRWRPRSASPPGWPSRRRCPSCPTPAGWRRWRCSTGDVTSQPFRVVDGALPVAARSRTWRGRLPRPRRPPSGGGIGWPPSVPSPARPYPMIAKIAGPWGTRSFVIKEIGQGIAAPVGSRS